MKIKRLSLFLLTALSLMSIGCGNDDGTDNSYVDIVMHVSENTVWNQVRGIDEPKEYMLVKERHGRSLLLAASKVLIMCAVTPTS